MKRILALLAFALIIFGCKKSDDSGGITVTPTNSNLLGKYKQTAETQTVNGISVNTWTTGYHEACEMAATHELKTNGVYTYVTTCNGGSTSNSTWSLNGTTLTLGSGSATIEAFDGTKIVVSSTNTVNGMSVKTTGTLTKQ